MVHVNMIQLFQIDIEDGEEIPSYKNFISVDQVDILDDVPFVIGNYNISSLYLVLPLLVLVARTFELDDLHWCCCKTFEVNGRN